MKDTTPPAGCAELPVVAWRVEIRGCTCVVFATTKKKAQWIATKAYWEVYERNGWPRAVAWRARQFDDCKQRFEKPKAWSEDYL